MEDMSAMNYEYFIRRCHYVGRHGTKGADADDFRRLQRYYHEYQESLGAQASKQRNKIASDYEKQLAMIRDYIDKAISTALVKFEVTFSQAEHETLNDLRAQLANVTLEKLVGIIEKAGKIMIHHKIYPR